MTTPPATWDSQVNLLTTRPQSCTATNLVQRTTPVSVSTNTSATCTPPTCTLDRPGVQSPVPLTLSMPSRAHAFFHSHSLPVALSTILPGLMARSSFFASSRSAILANSASRAAEAALRMAGAVPGSVVLPPEPPDGPNGLSPIRTVMSFTSRPRVSAVTIATTVRSPVPRSCVEQVASTEPSLEIVTLTSLPRLPPPPQVCRAMPMPCLTGPSPGPFPGGCHLFFQSESWAAILISSV